MRKRFDCGRIRASYHSLDAKNEAQQLQAKQGQIIGNPWPWLPVEAMARSLAAIVAVSLLLSLSAAYGTGAVPLLPRTTFWVSLLITARLTALAVEMAVRAGTRSWPQWAATGAYLIAATPAITLSLSVVTSLLFHAPFRWEQFVGLLAPVLVITAFMTLLFGLLDKVPIKSHARALTAVEPVALVARLPAHLKDADIHAVSAEDHYLRVHTSLGDTLILLGFARALQELDGIEGTQTHRSHWVAKAAIVGVDKRRGYLGFRLKGGLAIPVSRTYQKALRADGWLSP